jgi:hypothetical protein
MTNERILQISDKHLQLYKRYKDQRPDDAWLLSNIAGAVDDALRERTNKLEKYSDFWAWHEDVYGKNEKELWDEFEKWEEKRKILFEKGMVNADNIKIGLEVIDDGGTVGTIMECDDIHNIVVDYKDGGSGFYCLVEGCSEHRVINGDKYIVPYYDRLYFAV